MIHQFQIVKVKLNGNVDLRKRGIFAQWMRMGKGERHSDSKQTQSQIRCLQTSTLMAVGRPVVRIKVTAI